MRNRLLVVSLVFLAAMPALAQNVQPPRPAPGAPKKAALTGKMRGKFIIRQLGLSPEQVQQAEGLIESHYAQPADDPDTILARVRALTEELRKAEEEKNKAEIDRISEELRKIGRGETDESQFLDNLRLILKDDQKARLSSTLELLKTNPSGELRPIDVYRLVKGMSLSAEELVKLEEATTKFREQSSNAAPARDQATLDAQHAELLNAYVGLIRDALPEAKRAAFAKEVDSRLAK